MTDTYPQLAELEIDTVWSGLMSYARHRMPQIGRLPSGLWHCTAFGGHGLNTTAIGGRVVAEAILGNPARQPTSLRLLPLNWTGGLVGMARGATDLLAISGDGRLAGTKGLIVHFQDNIDSRR